MPIITLTTDFGTRDGYVGAMKGVIASRHPEAVIVDLAHDIPPFDVAHAAWVVATAGNSFPEATIHVVVVDPGVGGARANVVVRAPGAHVYVGPDNGVFAYVAPETTSGHAVYEAWRIENPSFQARRPSRTFNGRDIYAHAAAMLARGEPASVAGPAVKLAGRLPWGPRSEREGRVVHIDRFGNLITDLPAREAGSAIVIGGQTLAVVGTYEDVAVGEPLAYIGSARTVEIAVREGRASERFGVARGTLVVPAVAADAVIRNPYR